MVRQPGQTHVSAPRRVRVTCFLLGVLQLAVAGLSASENRGRAVMESGVSLAMGSSGCENMPLSALHSVLLSIFIFRVDILEILYMKKNRWFKIDHFNKVTIFLFTKKKFAIFL